MRSQGSAKELERRRLLAVRRMRQGMPAAEVARFLGVNERTARRWRSADEAGGDAALAAKPSPPPRSRLGEVQWAEAISWLSEDPAGEPFGYPTGQWTGARVADQIRLRFGVRYNPRHLLRELRKRDVTPQAVRRRPRGHDPEAMGKWAREEWPRVKKKRRSRRRGS
jgi:transposase